MTNGEKIQKDFKGCEVCEPIVEDDIIHVIFADKKDSAIGFELSWWNMEYQETCNSEIPTSSNDLSSGLENVSPIIDWNNCHTPEQLESMSTTKNDLAVDCVSRQAVDELVWKYLRKETDENIAFYEHFLDLPPVTPIRPKGHWIENAPEYQNIDPPYICSECGNMHLRKTNYCDQCGADMREVEK